MYLETINPLVALCTRNELFCVQERGQTLTISERKKFSVKPQNKKELLDEIIPLIDYEPIWLTMPYFEDFEEPGDCLGEVSLKTTRCVLIAPETVNKEGVNYLKASMKLNLDDFTHEVDEASRFRFLFEGKDIFDPTNAWKENRSKTTHVFVFIPIGGIKKIQLKIEPY